MHIVKWKTLWHNTWIIFMSYLSLVSCKEKNYSQQCRLISDPTECVVWSSPNLFALKIEALKKWWKIRWNQIPLKLKINLPKRQPSLNGLKIIVKQALWIFLFVIIRSQFSCSFWYNARSDKLFWKFDYTYSCRFIVRSLISSCKVAFHRLAPGTLFATYAFYRTEYRWNRKIYNLSLAYLYWIFSFLRKMFTYFNLDLSFTAFWMCFI